MIIRQAGPEDAVSLAELARTTYAEAFGHSFLPGDLRFYLETKLTGFYFEEAVEVDVILVAATEGRPIGFAQFGAAGLLDRHAPDDQELRRLYVDPDFQNRGIGRRLMDACLAHPRMRKAPGIFLDVWERNHGAQRFYKRYGFETIGSHGISVASGTETDQDLIMVRRPI